MIGLALSGGGSRAIAFHLGCLRALSELGLLERVGVISTISGGSVVGAYYAYTPNKTFIEFESEVRTHLRRGFHRSIMWQLLMPWNLLHCGVNLLATKGLGIANQLIGESIPVPVRYPSRTDIFHRVLQKELFQGLQLSSQRRGNLEVVVGACELRTGSAFRFGNRRSGSWRIGELVDNDVDLGLAVAASAAYPILLPTIDRKWRFRKHGEEHECRVLLTDGGVYDNLGIQVLEPHRDAKVSIHTFPCSHLIVCNAGAGLDSGDSLPLGFTTRFARSFGVVHRRVQDAAMHRLHSLATSGAIRGFAMPYLGQQDDSLPWHQDDLVPRSSVVAYPTNFAPMSEEWIERLSGRGEQLTRGLVSHYLSELL